MPGAGYYRGFLLEADTGNVTKAVDVLTDDGASHAYTGGPSSSHVRHNGQSQLEYAFATPFVAHMPRLAPADAVPWQLYGVRWVFDPWPELSTEASPWLPVRAGSGASFLQGLVVPVETSGAAPSINLIDDAKVSYTLLSSITPPADVKTPVPFWLPVPVITHEAQLAPNSPCRIWMDEIRFVADELPESASVWSGEATGFGMPGYKHARDGYVALISTHVAILSVVVDGVMFGYQIPSTGGRYRKVYLVFDSMKGLVYQASVVSPQPFRLFRKDCELRIRSWGDTGPYRSVSPFGDESMVTGARI